MIPSMPKDGVLALRFQDSSQKQRQFADQPPDGCEELCVNLRCNRVSAIECRKEYARFALPSRPPNRWRDGMKH